MRKLAFAVLLGVFTLVTARAEEGMWLYNALPLQALKDKYGFEPSPEWLEHLMKSSVRFNSGGSGSFVSSRGLVLTNHHVARSSVQQISSAENDYIKNGFFAKTDADEIKIPNLELNVLQRIEDVTERVRAVEKAGLSPAEIDKARKAAIAEIELEFHKSTGLRADVVTLYGGAKYHIYLSKKYTDIRLAFVPEDAIGYFGGDEDNFEFPRYVLDMTLFRVYDESGKPLSTPDYLSWATQGANEGDLVFVSGHPGHTERMMTADDLMALKGSTKTNLDILNYKRDTMMMYGARGEEQKRQAGSALFSINNSMKVYLARNKILNESSLVADKQKEQGERVEQAKAKGIQDYETALTSIKDAIKRGKGTSWERYFIAGGGAFDSSLFGMARTLVRLADEDQKANSDRLPEYQEAGRKSLEANLFSTAPIYPEFEKFKLQRSLEFFIDQMGRNHPQVRTVLAEKGPGALARELVNGTMLTDVNFRKSLKEGGKAAIEASNDPMILMARIIDAEARALRKDFEENVESAKTLAYANVAKAIFAIDGERYPDATFTLRLSYGTVKSYEQDGKHIPAHTLIGGTFDHEVAHGAKGEYVLPKSWHDARSQIQGDVPFNFVMTNDIIGGNSGSPVVNRQGHLVGLIFDGNRQSFIWDWKFDDVQGRSLSVDCRGMLEALGKVYKADRLVNEMTLLTPVP